MQLARNIRRLLSRNYRRFDAVRRFLAVEKRNAARAGAGLRPAMLLRGLTSDKAAIYDARRLARYWPDFDATGGHRTNGSYAALLDHKDLLHNLLARLDAGPAVLGLVRRGRYRPFDQPHDRELDEFIGSVDAVLLRHLDVRDPEPPRLLRRNGSVLLLDSTPVDTGTLAATLAARTTLVVASPTSLAAGGIGPTALRFVTMLRDPASGTPFCAFVLRPADAAASLGDCLATAVPAENDSDRETAAALADRVMRALPMLRAASFVLARDAEGFRIVDASNVLDVAAAQRHGPLLDDPRIEAAYTAMFRPRRQRPPTATDRG